MYACSRGQEKNKRALFFEDTLAHCLHFCKVMKYVTSLAAAARLISSVCFILPLAGHQAAPPTAT